MQSGNKRRIQDIFACAQAFCFGRMCSSLPTKVLRKDLSEFLKACATLEHDFHTILFAEGIYSAPRVLFE